jgi:hypothetical protein
MIPLPIIADRLEQEGEPALAAAVRLLGYAESEGLDLDSGSWHENALTVALQRAVARFMSLGEPEMADSLDDQERDIRTYGKVIPRTDRRPPPIDITADAG